MEVAELRFRVMASTVEVLLVEPSPGAIETVPGRLAELEQRWSRFIDTSDISRFNAAEGAAVEVTTDTIRLVEAMQLAHRATGGGFDPTYLHRLMSVGYTTSIDDPSRFTVPVDARSDAHSVHDVVVDRSASTLQAPRGVSLDPGGIGKGFAADLVVTELLASGTEGALVGIGGDIAAGGRGATPNGWFVHVADPLHDGEHFVTIEITGGGIATSSTLSRRWRHDGAEVHHVIDPITGAVSDTDLAAVTVIASAGWSAEAHAKAALLSGRDGVIGHLVDHGLSGLAVAVDGTVLATDDIDIDTARPGTHADADSEVQTRIETGSDQR